MKLSKIFPFIGIALFVYIIRRIGVGSVIQSVQGINYFYIIIALIFLPLVIMLQSLKWKVILDRQKIGIGIAETIKIQLVSIFYGFITPARIGSFIKIAYLQEKIHNLGKSASSVVIDRILDLLTVLLLAGLGSLFLASKFSKVSVYILIIALCAAVLTALLLFESRSRLIFKFVYSRMLPAKIKPKAKKSFDNFYNSIPSHLFLLVPFGLSILTWLATYLQVFFVAKSLGISLAYPLLVGMLAISTLFSLLPISIAGLGTREAALVTLLGFFSIPAAKVVTMSLLGVLTTNILVSLFGLWFSIKGTKPEFLKEK
ncbi:MAG: lysylphosphatidylglycerol synthase transmembrane domain-containing protein [archaeon]